MRRLVLPTIQAAEITRAGIVAGFEGKRLLQAAEISRADIVVGGGTRDAAHRRYSGGGAQDPRGPLPRTASALEPQILHTSRLPWYRTGVARSGTAARWLARRRRQYRQDCAPHRHGRACRLLRCMQPRHVSVVLAEDDEHVWEVAELQQRGAERHAEFRAEGHVATHGHGQDVATHGHGQVDQAARERKAVARKLRASCVQKGCAAMRRGRAGGVERSAVAAAAPMAATPG